MNRPHIGAARVAASSRVVLSAPAARNVRSFPKPDADSVLVCPVGGVGQIGMNWTLYGHAGRWLLVDAGTAFAPREIEGVEAIFPDVSSLRDVLPFLDGLVVTHAHEDHIGAIHRLWPTIKCPVYATPFASAQIRNRLAEAGTIGKVKMRSMQVGGSIRVGPFDIRAIRMTHSVPEAVALAIRTQAGTVLHTSDWKFDAAPVIGEPTDIRTLRRLGDRGVLAMVSDSTNATRSTSARTTEAQVGEGFRKVFARTKGAVVVACFSTNVARIASAAMAAHATGRRFALAGRSLLNSEKSARSCGLLKGVPRPAADARMIKGEPKRQIALMCTGAQGEGNASLAKLADGGNFRLPKLGPGDVVIHSARIIPGNESDIHAVFDKLREQGVTILQEEFEDSPLHSSGHASADEIAEMYALVRPRFAIPVHGEAEHLLAHAAIAARAGVKDAAFSAEGDVWRVSQDGVERVASVPLSLNCELTSSRGSHVAWNPDDPFAALADAEAPRVLEAA